VSSDAHLSSDERDAVLLRELQDLITLTIARVSVDKEAFLADPDKRDATALRVQAIGEHLRSLSPEFREVHPELPWRRAIGMRNIIAHDYGELDYEIVYNVVAGEPFAALRTEIARIISERAV
jgi:uncharacterized protein with HEPN domain